MQKKSFPLTRSELGPLAGVRAARQNLKLCAKMRVLAEDPKKMLFMAAHFWSKVKRGNFNHCWIWNGKIKESGYGSAVLVTPTMISAHRMAYFLIHGPPPPGFCVCHHCDNPKCVNPRHLYLGTQGDNMRDRDIRGRTQRGANHSKSKLSAENVLWMRTAVATGTHSIPAFAHMFKVSDSCARMAVSGKNWKHL